MDSPTKAYPKHLGRQPIPSGPGHRSKQLASAITTWLSPCLAFHSFTAWSDVTLFLTCSKTRPSRSLRHQCVVEHNVKRPYREGTWDWNLAPASPAKAASRQHHPKPSGSGCSLFVQIIPFPLLFLACQALPSIMAPSSQSRQLERKGQVSGRSTKLLHNHSQPSLALTAWERIHVQETSAGFLFLAYIHILSLSHFPFYLVQCYIFLFCATLTTLLNSYYGQRS